VSPPDGVSRLGEVLISCPQAKKQAKEHNHPIERELALLLSHGVLHLLGYEHEDSASTDRMKTIEETIMGELSHEHLL
jgi:probable rRNA maturation factor